MLGSPVLLLLGLGLSFIASVPMSGPLGALVLDRASARKHERALLVAGGGSCVEGIIAAVIAAFIPNLLAHSGRIEAIARAVGATVILLVGVVLAAFPRVLDGAGGGRGVWGVGAGILATALNPTLIASWTVVVTSLYTQGWLEGGLANGLSFGSGVALGSFAWFASLVGILHRFKPEALFKHRYGVMRAVGILLASAGAALLARTAQG